jgi:uroporphyrin-III C-methyltransferase
MMISPGIVYLVGAGPGDPDLITVKGLKCLQTADVVIYDRLANPALLDYAPLWAERIYAGKEPQRHRLSQEKINDLLIEKATQGLIVVRLKGGDPFVFGRGGEEALALARAGISFEVVPGISSAVAVPAYAGIPVTHRHLSTSFTTITGHTTDDDPNTVDWDDLPKNGTLVILMGVCHLPEIALRLVQGGRASDTPAAAISWGTTPQQAVIVGTLADIAQKAARLSSPSIIVVGEVINLQQEIQWFKPYLTSPFQSLTGELAGVSLPQTSDVPL